MCRRWHALDIVIDIGRDVVLEMRGHLFDVVAGLTAVDLLAQLLIAAHDVDEFVRKVVVHALVVVHDDRRTDGEWGDGEHGADHPRGATVLWIKSENADGGVGEALEASQYHLGLQRYEFRGVGGGTGLLPVERADGALDLYDLVEHRGLASRAGNNLLAVLGRLCDGVDGVFSHGCEAVHACEFGLQVAHFSICIRGDDV